MDYTCIIHGKKMSEHDCLYCCLCFKPLTMEECHIRPDGKREDVCDKCTEEERVLIELHSRGMVSHKKGIV